MVRVLTFAVFVVLGGCQRRSAEAPSRSDVFRGDTLPVDQGTPALEGELRVAMEAEPPSLNYQLDPLDMWAKKIDELLYESLARPHPTRDQHEPRLAQRWEVSADNLSFTFHLRRDVRWHDGAPFTADDVVFTFDKLRDPRVKAAAIRSYLEPLERCSALDAFTVRCTLKRSTWYAFDAIAEIFIYPRHIYEHGDFNSHPNNRAPIGTGRFRYERWLPGAELALTRNDDYFGSKARLSRLVFKVIPDANARLQALRRGDVHVLERVSPDVWGQVAHDADVAERFHRLRHVPSGLQWIGWNLERPQFKDPRVRLAMTMLLDRKGIVDNLRLGLDDVATSWFYPGSPEHDPTLRPHPYDPETALQLLADAGFSDTDLDGVLDRGGVPLRFTFLVPAVNPFYDELALLLQRDFKKAGIAVEMQKLEWAPFMERLRRHDFDACSLSWQLYPRSDPYQIWHSKEADGGSNFVAFKHPLADRLLEAARAEFDGQRRVALYRRFARLLHEQEPYTLLFNRYNLSLVSKDFGGIASTPYGVFRYDDFYRRADRVAGVTD